MSPLYNVFRFKTEENLDFYEHYLSTKHWHRYMNEVANYGARSDRMAISSSDLLNLPLPYPSQKEQEKISEFLSGVDKKIDLLSKKKKWLVKYKKALMQKIFSQEIRFKDENGQDYPEWKEKKLGELGEFRTSSVDKIIKPDEIEVYLVNYMNVYRHEEISIKTKPSLSKTSVKPAQLVSSNLQAGDILFTPSSETPSDIGHSVVVRDNLEDTVFSYHLVRFRPLTGLSQDYSNYFCNDQKVLRQFAEYAQGATRFTISREAFQNITVIIPFSLKEQQKIADLLNSIDEKIEAEERKLEKAKEFKKALLQQMFV
jgi:type I restriction enzyme S subunit